MISTHNYNEAVFLSWLLKKEGYKVWLMLGNPYKIDYIKERDVQCSESNKEKPKR